MHHVTGQARWLDDAEHNLRFVRLGHGLHNVTYARALLSVVRENAAKVQRTLDGKPAEEGDLL